MNHCRCSPPPAASASNSARRYCARFKRGSPACAAAALGAVVGGGAKSAATIIRDSYRARSLARASQPAATSGGQQVAAKCAARRPAAGQRAAEMTGRARARPSSAHLHFIARDPSRASSAELRASARGCFQRVLSRDCCRRRRRRCSSCYSATTGWLRVTQQRGAIM